MPNSNSKVLEGLLYLSPKGDRYKGHLTITDSELIFETEFEGVFERTKSINQSLNDRGNFLSLLKEDISSIEIKKSYFSQKIVLSLNGKIHIFKKVLTLKKNLFKEILI